MEPLPETIRQQFIAGISLQEARLIPANVKYKLWSRLFWGLITFAVSIFMIAQAILQPIWPNPDIIRENWPSSLLLIILVLGWYIAIGYFVYWTFARIVLLIGQRQEQSAQAKGVCHYGMWLTDDGLAIRLRTRPFSKTCEWYWAKTAVTGASSFLKRDSRNIGHWHLRISYINKKDAETSTSFPYDELQCRHIDELVQLVEDQLIPHSH